MRIARPLFHSHLLHSSRFQKPLFAQLQVNRNISSAAVEDTKRAAANLAVRTHFIPGAAYVGIGSGSTVPYVIKRIQQLPAEQYYHTLFIPTGYQSRDLIQSAGLRLGAIDTIPARSIDVTFDGADEVDPWVNCIKGGGGCLLLEKLVAVNSKKFIVVADQRKLSPSLTTQYNCGIPLEVLPAAAPHVLSTLQAIGFSRSIIRTATGKAGPVLTDHGNFIIDALSSGQWQPNWQGLGAESVVEALAKQLKDIVGVVEHGIFWRGDRKPDAAYFGMEDGTVRERNPR